MRKKIFSVIIASCAIIVSSASLHGQDTQVDSSVNNTGTNVSGDAEDITKSKRSSDAIIITGRRYESSVLKEGKSVTVITEEEIKNSGKSDLSQVLETVPGITVSREGTDAGSANIFIRGTKSGNVLVLVDGVRINDPAGTGKTVDLSLFRTDNIERIEIVEGSMSSLYGAEASSGVINIITKKGRGNSLSLKFTGGMYDTFSQSLLISEDSGKGSFFFSGSHFTSGGISTARDMTGTGGFDEDSVERYVASCRMNGSFRDNTSLAFSMNYMDKEMDVDDAAGADDPDNTASNSLFGTSVEFRHVPFAWWNYDAGVSLMSLERIYNSPPTGISTFDSSVKQGHLLNHFRVPVAGTVSIGAEIMDESAGTSSGTSFLNKNVTTMSLYVHDACSFAEMLFLNAGARVDNHSAFGNNYTWDASGAFIIPAVKTKIRGSAGTGFKAPSLFELYDANYGDPELEPEKSFVTDAGIRQEFAYSDNLISVECTYFYQRYTNMLSYDPNTYRSKNIGGVMSDRGLEFAASLKLSGLLSAAYSFTYIDFLKNNSGSPFLRRPEQKHSLVINVHPAAGLNINLSYLYTGSRYDIQGYDAFWAPIYCKLDPYHKIDANIRYSFNQMLTVTVRGENLTDADYMEAYGYNTYGRSFFGGIELTF